MKQTLNLICLRTVRHSERHDILTAYSREAGRVAFAIPAGAGREAARRRALLMPLSLVECVADIRPGRDVHLMKDPRALTPLYNIRINPVKSAIALFVAEVLTSVVREGPADSLLFDYAARSIEALERMTGPGVANFHICFIVGLSRFLGIEPDVADYSRGMVFDMMDGRFRATPPVHGRYLDPTDSEALTMVLRMNFANLHLFRFNHIQRNAVLDMMMEYFSLHHAALTNLRSLDVVRELF